MSSIGQYIFSVIAAAVMTSIATRLTDGSSSLSKFIKLFSGIFLVITLISPLKDFTLSEVTDYFTGIEADASSLKEYADAMTRSEMESFIKAKTEAYILDKASDLDLDVAVAVEVSSSNTPLPTKVKIQGIASPYSKQHLTRIITNDLGIPKEQQLWISKQVSER